MITLVTGAARSGKTRFALKHAGEREPRVYIATAELLDEEMRERARRHQQERSSRWMTIEEPLNLVQPLSQTYPVFVIDCLTLWLSNWLLRDSGSVPAQIESLKTALSRAQGDVIAITNEVGWSVVPDNQLARSFRDWSGKMNQEVADIADAVYVMVCGIPVRVKGN